MKGHCRIALLCVSGMMGGGGVEEGWCALCNVNVLSKPSILVVVAFTSHKKTHISLQMFL
jgi:hypothetical protein